MCRMAYVRPAKFDCKNRGELAQALGGQPIYANTMSNRPSDCLCGLDEVKTAQQYGLDLLSAPGDWVVVFSDPKKAG